MNAPTEHACLSDPPDSPRCFTWSAGHDRDRNTSLAKCELQEILRDVHRDPLDCEVMVVSDSIPAHAGYISKPLLQIEQGMASAWDDVDVL
jgi:hypothetical protein